MSQTSGCSIEDEKADTAPWGRLVPTSKSIKYEIIELIGDKILLGRDPARCDVILSELQISGIHSQICRNCNTNNDNDTHDGIPLVTITDLSTNGTFINERKIGKNKTSVLFDGDEIQFIKAKKARKGLSFIFYKHTQRISHPSSILNKYDLRKKLVTGSFATIKLGIDKITGDQYRIKEIDKKKYQKRSTSRDILNEANVLKIIDHDNIIKFYEAFDEDDKLYIVLGMALGGDLFERIISEKKLSENIARYVLRQIVGVVMYLHDNRIAHRNLKVIFIHIIFVVCVV